MKRLRSSDLLILTWVFTSLFIAHFHEPWRDEAQEWLLSKNALSVYDLFLRLSKETGFPLYYFFLRPITMIFPTGFPDFLFWFSWTGSLLFVFRFARSQWIPLPWRILVLFGFLFGYEYAAISRVYGWGSFFLWSGICADRKNRTSSAYWFVLACLTHVTYVLAVGVWCVYRWEHWLKIKKLAPLLLNLFLLILFIQMGAHIRGWPWVQLSSWRFISNVGTIVSTPFIQGPHLDAAGWLVLPLALFSLNTRGRLALLLGMAGCIFLFGIRYHGFPYPRHVGFMFLLWIVFACESLPNVWKGSWKTNVVTFLLSVSFVSGLVMAAQDILFPFSDGMRIANTIETVSKSQALPPKVFVDDSAAGYVVAAKLNLELWHRDGPLGCPHFSAPCETKKIEVSELMEQAKKQRNLTGCAQTHACFLVAWRDSPTPTVPTGTWVLVDKPQDKTLRERLELYEWKK